MSLPVALSIAGFAAALFMLTDPSARVMAIVAAIASGIEVAMAFGLVRLSVAHLPLGLVLGLCLAVPGILGWIRSSSKTAVSAAAVVSLVGILQVVAAVGRRL